MNPIRELSDQLQDLVETELNDGEAVLWAGQPRPGRAVIKSLPIVWPSICLDWVRNVQFAILDDEESKGYCVCSHR